MRHTTLPISAVIIALIIFVSVMVKLVNFQRAPSRTSPVPATVTKNVLTILWDPHRVTDPAPSKAAVEQMLFGAAPSMKQYYVNQSNGLVNMVNAGVLGWYDADKPAEHYWADITTDDPDHDGFNFGHIEKWAEAIYKANMEFDFASYDTNGDHILSPDELGILIVIPQNDPFGTNRDVFGQEYPTKLPLIVDGVKISFIAEVYIGSPVNIGAASHELGHLFFYMPDMYIDPAPSYRAQNYSLMDNAYNLSQFDPYNKYWHGWIDVQNVTADGFYTVNSIETSHVAFKITRSGTNEFFLIENRQHGTYDQGIADTGIAIWDIIDDRDVNDWGRLNIHMIRAVSHVNPDDSQALWHGPGGIQGRDAALNWIDGSASGVVLKSFPASSSSMRVYIDVP